MKNTLTLRKPALYTGWAIVVMAVLAGIAYGGVLQHYLIPGQAITKATEIQKNLTSFGLALALMAGVAICDLIVTFYGYYLFQKTNSVLSLITSLFRLVYTLFLIVALTDLLGVVNLIKENQAIDQIANLVERGLIGFSTTWAYGLIVFGCYLILLGILCHRSGFVPRIWSILLVIAGLCYIVTSGGEIMLENYHNYKPTLEMILALPMTVAELGFGVWLLVKGRKVVLK